MTDTPEIADRLRHFAEHIGGWKTEAARLTRLVAETRDTPDSEQLVALEQTATDIYDDISAFRTAVDEVAAKSQAAASELAGVSDALHLVLLEITELGLQLYGRQSGLEPLPDPAQV
jgi:hypothetical protein